MRYWVRGLYPYRRLHKSPGQGRRTGQTMPNTALQAFNGRRLFGQSLSRLLTAAHPFTQDHYISSHWGSWGRNTREDIR